MGYLKDKIIKRKKLLKSSESHVLIIPNNWINEMNWDRTMILKMIWRPDEHKIIITEDDSNNKLKEGENEEVSESIAV